MTFVVLRTPPILIVIGSSPNRKRAVLQAKRKGLKIKCLENYC
jgi:porphobilinogen deaminase